ncbi:hypothetical protein RIF29_07593 [Crotalaria pallida]|uniref:Uncharacterized protein n=1 Tax=Crotalaria pallida TaxID=3830 RepID=A0AAN9PBZ5_CROPI
MAATGASFNVFEGSISIHDMEVERRPYHKNCGCALHNLNTICSKACPQKTYISFNKKISWTHFSMYITAASNSKLIPYSSSSSSSVFLPKTY